MRGRPQALVETEVCCPSALTGELDDKEAVDLARAFAALGDPVRLQLMNLIASAESGEVCVCELVGPVARSQPTVSHHLRILAEAGLVVSEKRGKWSWFSVVPQRVAVLRAALVLGRRAEVIGSRGGDRIEPRRITPGRGKR